MVHLPVGIPGWTVFVTGLLIVAYRIHGIDNPRAWAEALEHQFTTKRPLQFLGGLLLIGALALGWLGIAPGGALGWLYAFSIGMLALLGLGLAVAQNHLRLLVVATAEAEDKTIRLTSGIIVVTGLLWALAPWFL